MAGLLASIMAACTFELADVKPVAVGDAGPSDAGAGGAAGAADASLGGSGGVGGSGGTAGDAGPWPHDGPSEVNPYDTGTDAPDGAGGTAGSAGAGGAGGTGGPAPITNTLRPATGLGGDGFLSNPALCGETVWDFYEQSTYKAVHVGRDVPCSNVATYRAFMRFNLQNLAGAAIVSAILRFELRSKTDVSSAVNLVEIEDFGNLGAGDWGSAERQNLGQVFGPGTALGWVETDVTGRVVAALSSGVIAFKLQYGDESEDPAGKSRWYGITATDDGASRAPQLVVSYVP